MAYSRFLSLIMISVVFATSCKKQTENIIVRYEISSSVTNKFKVSYFSDLDAERGTKSIINVDGGYWTANHIGQKFEPYYIEVTHDTSSKPPYNFELFIIANDDTIEHVTDTTRFGRVILKGRKL